ncbi:hypothetical protein VTP01DRAFT_7849 [Rhizomucor pusillus]|uniref:uncharacterized protein n=1 Tax=Rhizomucor pusillus TaxID=4840 RepID=UPI00374474EF
MSQRMLPLRRNVVSIQGRLHSTAAVKGKRKATKQHENLFQPIQADMIGTPDPISNLRPVRYYIPPDETEAEKEWRLMQQRVDEFNQDFWTRNNSMFLQAKAEYEEQLKQRGKQVTPEALSIFYKDFLDAAYERHMEYNRQWWKLNIGMLYPGFKATMRSLFQSRTTQAVQQQRETSFWEKSFES